MLRTRTGQGALQERIHRGVRHHGQRSRWSRILTARCPGTHGGPVTVVSRTQRRTDEDKLVTPLRLQREGREAAMINRYLEGVAVIGGLGRPHPRDRHRTLPPGRTINHRLPASDLGELEAKIHLTETERLRRAGLLAGAARPSERRRRQVGQGRDIDGHGDILDGAGVVRRRGQIRSVTGSSRLPSTGRRVWIHS